MPTKARREDALLEVFLSAYDENTWADAELDWLDQRRDGAVEVLATRSDGRTLAVEHTLIEFFKGERTDLERFRPFLRIESDHSLAVPGKWIDVNLPRGVLDGLKPNEQDRMVNAVHEWLRANIRSLPSGETLQTCHIAATDATPARDVALQADVRSDATHAGSPPLIRRYGQVGIAETVERALNAKLPKLLRTKVDERVLMLERSQMKLDEREIMSEVEKHRPTLAGLAAVDVWIAETVFYDTAESAGWRGYVDFKRYVDGRIVEQFAFSHGKLRSRSKDGIPIPLN
jgi:hypothetical protein